MYRNKNHSNSYIIIILDIVCIMISYVIAIVERFTEVEVLWENGLYRTGIIITLLVYCCVAIIVDHWEEFYHRGYLKEFVCVFEINLLVAGTTTLLLFFTQQGVLYSRAFFAIYIVVDTILMYLVRSIYKKMVRVYFNSQKHTVKLLIATTEEGIEKEYDRLYESLPVEYEIIGISVLDKNLKGDSYRGTPIVSNGEDLYEFARKSAVDEVFISLPGYPVPKLDSIILTLEHMGIVVNLNIKTFGLYPKEKMINSFSGFHVLTYSTKVFHKTSLLLKRAVDIIGSIVGLIITACVSIFVIPAILIESPGPVFFSQVRIGKNGRRFKMYKFRSMYQDAEERKRELLEKNEMQGFMFKMKDDPRITKVGKFLRDTSLDELPQFFNVLKGDMSLVGTRPPTEDEFLQYNNDHKRRLSLKPGITGLWQVSGRSDITDFEEVVKLDLEYIDNWTIGFDFMILFKTVGVVFKRDGSR